MHSTLIRRCREIETTIDDYCNSGGSGVHKKLKPMRRELVGMLLLQRQPEKLRALPLRWKKITADLDDRSWRLSLAVEVIARHGLTKNKAARLWGVPISDIEYAFDLMKSLDIRTSDIAADADPTVRSVVEAHFEGLRVNLDQRAVEDLLLAAAETYAVKPGGRGKKYTEAYGLCLGNRKRARINGASAHFETIVNISRITTQMRAAATANEVRPNWQSQQVHLGVGEKLFPHLELLGDYHTHPYKDLETLRVNKGWKYSDADQNQIIGWHKSTGTQGFSPRFSVIVAVARGGKAGRSAKRLAKNRVQLTVDDLYFVIAAYRIRGTGHYDTDAQLSCPQVSDM